MTAQGQSKITALKDKGRGVSLSDYICTVQISYTCTWEISEFLWG